MTQTIRCPQCGKPFTCNPDGDCWCKSYPPLTIPDALKGEQCLCRCVLDKLHQEQAGAEDADTKPSPGDTKPSQGDIKRGTKKAPG